MEDSDVPNKVLKKESVGVFDGYDDLYETIKELGIYGFGRHQISVRGSDAAVKQHFGDAPVAVEQLEDSPRAPRSPLIGAEELGVAQGVLVGASIYVGAALAVLATDGLARSNSVSTLLVCLAVAGVIGVALAQILGVQYRKFFSNQAATGGLVLWVETPSIDEQQTAQSILHKHHAHDVHTHMIAMAA